MPHDFSIRLSTQSDWPALEQVYPKSFPDENLLPLIRDLMPIGEIGISLVATNESRIIGHAIFTNCSVSGRSVKAALLGPVAVEPAWQRRGIGTALIRVGLQRLKSENCTLVCVLGDPAFYSKFGFTPEPQVQPPFQLPSEWVDAWQSHYLQKNERSCIGILTVPTPWMHRDLWTP